jgi:hypothetical protein
MPSGAPTPPNARGRSGVASGDAGAVADVLFKSSLAMHSRRAAANSAADGAGAASIPAASTAASGWVSVEEWTKRAAALRRDAEAMLSGFPNRGQGRSAAAAAATASSAAANTAGESAVSKGGPWLYRYLLYEPVSLSRLAPNAPLSGRLGGSSLAEAADAGALWTATFGVGASDGGGGGGPSSSPSTVSVSVRLFPDVAPATISYVKAALGALLKGGHSTACAVREVPGAPAVAASAEKATSGSVVLSLAGSADVPPAELEKARIEQTRLVHERAGLISVLLPMAGVDVPRPARGACASAPPTTASTVKEGGAPADAAGALAVSFGAAAPFGARGVVVGRVIDGEHALKQLVDARSAAATLSLLEWRPTEVVGRS